MPDETQSTLNPDGINQMVGASSAPIASDGLNDPNLDTQRTNTVDDPAVSSTAKDDKAGTDKVNEDKEKQDKTDKAQDGDDDRLDKHPRFKEVIEQRNQEREARIRAEERAKVLEEQSRTTGKEKTGEEKQLPFEDISQLTDDELDERWVDNKKKFIGNLYLQIEHEIFQKIKHESEQEKTLTSKQQEFNDFRKANPDFDELWGKDGGKILDYMNDHPDATRKEAYYALTVDSKIERAKQEAVEAERKKFDGNRQAKRDASNVLGTGSPAAGGGNDVFQEKLKDTQKHGGIVSVLAEKVQAMRRSSR